MIVVTTCTQIQADDINQDEKKKDHQSKNVWQSGKLHPLIVNDSSFKIQIVAQGLEFPTTMAFNGPNDILVLEKEKGSVRRIVDGNLISKPLLKFDVKIPSETCMCGIAVSKNDPARTYVYLYLTEIQPGNQGDNISDLPVSNNLYRYELENDKLVDPKKLLNLPPTSGPHHTGGAIMLGPDNNVYLSVGDLDDVENNEYFRTLAQNYKDSMVVDGRAGILRVTPEGNPVANGILGKNYPLSLYYAYGVRNSFGMDFDPVTGNLWDTENGPAYGDEINLVEPGFNSGWAKVQGIWKPVRNSESGDFVAGNTIAINNSDLVDFKGTGNYSTPEFIWKENVGPTALAFLYSDKLGKQYENDIFVGSVGNGQIYHFELNENRTELVLPGKLGDKIADTDKEIEQSGILFGRDFGGITDIEVNPYDGYLYVVSFGDGKIFRIIPNDNGYQN
jgi:glucose/arabinose dehydrogenase